MENEKDPSLDPLRPSRAIRPDRPERLDGPEVPRPPDRPAPISRPERPDGGGRQPPTVPPGGADRPRPPSPPSSPPQADRPAEVRPKAAISRRSMFGLVGAAVVGAVLVPRLFKSGGLPDPSSQVAGPEYRSATLAVKPAPKAEMPTDRAAWPTCAAAAPASKLSGLDLVLVVDTTGSMGGVINDIRSNIWQLISNLQAGAGDVRMGVVAYRDTGDEYVVMPFPLTEIQGGGAAALSGFVGSLQASGGQDWPERMDAALQMASTMKWRRGVPGSIVVIADAPAHAANTSKAISSAHDFAGRGSGAQVSLIDTGSGGNPFMRELPAAGGGQYVTYDGDILKSLYPAITGCASK